MKMVPIYTTDGQILGHLNMDDCVQNRHGVTVENRTSPLNVISYELGEVSDTIEFCYTPFRTMRFRCGSQEQMVRCLVAEDLPGWFWDAYATVKFSPRSWERL